MRIVLKRCLKALAALAFVLTGAATAAETSVPDATVRQIWQQIDYVGVDYGGAVARGQVTSSSEYAEMQEFVGNALRGTQSLPASVGREKVIAAVQALRQAVDRRAAATEVAELSRQASKLLLAQYPILVTPVSTPDLQHGRLMYQSQCSGCHGATGHADGPLAATLDPKPVAFADPERARARSLLALYQIVSQGVPGTSMPSFGNLPDMDRWALAFFVGSLSYDEAMRERGAKLWRADAAAKDAFPNLAALTTSSQLVASQALGEGRARDLTAYLRSDPNAVVPTKAGSLSVARSQLQRSLVAARAGNSSDATRLALSAYLDGFEPVEPTLGARDKALLTEVEERMLSYRSALSAGKLDDAAAIAKQLDGLFTRAEEELDAGNADPVTTFVGALTILLREGVEALLIVVGMLAFLRKAERYDVMRHVHAGWVTALLAGGATWAIATYVVGISGASRELTEGLSSLFAAIVLLGVGLWMHQKSSAGRWQAYLHEKLSSAISRRSAWALFALSFVAVYREVFETVLFYSALAVDGNGAALVGGLVAGVVVLGIIAWVLLRTSARMPIGKFFSLSSILIAVLAVVLAGKGVAALQEAGWLSATRVLAPRIELLGVFPSAETLSAQLVVMGIAIIGFWINAAAGRRAEEAVAS